MSKKLIDLQANFFLPVWRRVAVVLACSIWTSLEIIGDNVEWALFASVITLYCFFQFFFLFAPTKK